MIGQPFYGLRADLNILGQNLGIRIVLFMQTGCKKHDVTVNFNTGLFLRALHIRYGNFSALRNAAHIQTNGLSEKEGERHFVDGCSVRTHVIIGVHMRTHMLYNGQVIVRGSDRILRRAVVHFNRFLVGHSLDVYRPRETIRCKHIILNAQS